MHALERHKRPDAFAPHRFESAARIADPVFGETAPDKVRDATGDPLQRRVLALSAITADQIGPALDLGD